MCEVPGAKRKTRVVSREDSKEGWSESEITDKSSGMLGHWQDIGNLDRVVGKTAG